MIDFRIESGDKIHFETCPKTIQNDIIDIIGEYISNKILVEITKSRFFYVLGDEVADASNQEQLSLILRFVDETNKVREEFLEFVCCSEKTSGEALSNIILTKLAGYGGLDIQ